ncbi:hypothetical protein C8J57DRAFT_1346351 [Mycena rebaudengoi]|nr:hypothetical protein C8J57DRAFT_1346351 [Mycena rebaudengoi]
MSGSSSSSPSSSASSLSSSPPRTPPNLHQNSIDPSSKWLVQKFGGTSVGKFAVNIAKDIVSSYIDSNKVAVVCSARSGSTKALGTTNLLLRAASEALRRRPPNAPQTMSGYATPLPNGIFGRSEESNGSQSPLGSPRPGSSGASSSASPTFPWAGGSAFTPLTPVAGWLPEFHATVDLIRQEHCTAARSSITDPVILRELEVEIERDCEWLRSFLSASQVIDEISPRSRDTIGIDAEYVSLENVVPPSDDLEAAEDGSLDQEFYDRLARAVGERVKQCGRRVPVVTGFFGPVPGSLLRQIGRGYTDLLSALLAVGLEAAELQIWKEAIRRKIPIRIKNVENPRGGGTVIHPDPEADTGDEVGSSADARKHHPRHPTAVTIKERIIVLNINSNRKSVSHGFLAGIFGTLDRFGVVVDLISTSEVHVSMAIEDGLAKKLMERLLRELHKSGTVTVHRDMAILSLVGKHMCNMIGIAGRMFTTLAQGGVNIEMISQGASEINISCVIDARDAVKALNLIHQSCLQLKEGGMVGRSVAVGPWLF